MIFCVLHGIGNYKWLLSYASYKNGAPFLMYNLMILFWHDANSGGSSAMARPTTTNPAMKRHRPVTPNITAIHQALFNRSQPPASDQVFLVKLPKAPTKKKSEP